MGIMDLSTDNSNIAAFLRSLDDDTLVCVLVDWLGGADVFYLLSRANTTTRSIRQVAESMGIPESTARSWIARAKTRMRRAGLDPEDLSCESAASGDGRKSNINREGSRA